MVEHDLSTKIYKLSERSYEICFKSMKSFWIQIDLQDLSVEISY